MRVGSRTAPIPFDWTDRGTWGPALAGASSVYLAFQPDLAVPGTPEIIADFAATARAAGVLERAREDVAQARALTATMDEFEA